MFSYFFTFTINFKDGNTNFGNINNDRTKARVALLFRRLFLALIKWKEKALLCRS